MRTKADKGRGFQRTRTSATSNRFSGPEDLFKTCVAMKFVDDDDDDDQSIAMFKVAQIVKSLGLRIPREQDRINLSGQSVHRFGGASTIFYRKN